MCYFLSDCRSDLDQTGTCVILWLQSVSVEQSDIYKIEQLDLKHLQEEHESTENLNTCDTKEDTNILLDKYIPTPS